MDNMKESLVRDLNPLYEKSRHPFAYADCRKLLHQGATYEGLAADLDLYLKDIAGYCTWGRRLLKWSKPEIEKALATLSRSFFEKNPEYKPLESQITEENTPDLYADLVLHEKMRQTLLSLFSLLRREN
jgi:hypothetical protein